MSHVLFRKQVSDGNYGSETAEVMLDVPLGEVYDMSEDRVAATLEAARRLVHEELRRSPSWRVRDAVTSSDEAAVTVPPDDPEDLPY